jgi:phage-related protein
MARRTLKLIKWVGSSRRDLKDFPAEVRDHVGFALYQAQSGSKSRDTKPLKGFGTGTMEVVSRHDGGTFRAVYTVRFVAVIYVLHSFQKKAKTGIATPKRELDVVRRRLKIAKDHYEANHAGR